MSVSTLPPKPKRAYLATIELEYIVVAEDSEEGKQEAKKLALQDFHDDQIVADYFELRNVTHLPAPYENMDEEVSHNGNGIITVAEAIKLKGGYAHLTQNSDLE